METLRRPGTAHVTTRMICALLTLLFISAFFVRVVLSFRAGPALTFDDLVGGIAGLPAIFIFGDYAIHGGRSTETGVVVEPSDEVRELARDPRSKVEAIKAYRQQTGVDLKRSVAVVERLASLERSDAKRR